MVAPACLLPNSRRREVPRSWLNKLTRLKFSIMSSSLDIFKLTDDDAIKFLVCESHVGTKKLDHQMEHYVWKRRSDGAFTSSTFAKHGRTRCSQGDHFKPLWARNVPRFGIAHAFSLGLGPWMAVEIPASSSAARRGRVGAEGRDQACFNCGTIGHELFRCPEPRDARRISQQFFQAMGKKELDAEDERVEEEEETDDEAVDEPDEDVLFVDASRTLSKKKGNATLEEGEIVDESEEETPNGRTGQSK
uniref:Ubiquitin-fold modifier-conjugating enzyme 1 n=1 Tax=Globodera pallida TaxID=36090 RepID=A0A183CH47_GLOPA